MPSVDHNPAYDNPPGEGEGEHPPNPTPLADEVEDLVNRLRSFADGAPEEPDAGRHVLGEPIDCPQCGERYVPILANAEHTCPECGATIRNPMMDFPATGRRGIEDTGPIPQVEPWTELPDGTQVLNPEYGYAPEVDPATHIEWMQDFMNEWWPHFEQKTRDYGGTAYTLAEFGQFADMHRKMGKLYQAFVLKRELIGEQPVEIVEDLLGHCLLTLFFLSRKA